MSVRFLFLLNYSVELVECDRCEIKSSFSYLFTSVTEENMLFSISKYKKIHYLD